MPQPIKCKKCGYETEIHFRRGSSIKDAMCSKCGYYRFTWNTDHLKRVRAERERERLGRSQRQLG